MLVSTSSAALFAISALAASIACTVPASEHVDLGVHNQALTSGTPIFDLPPEELYDRRAPTRIQVLGFPRDATAEVRRRWMPPGGHDFYEATGPNDKQVVGDFRGLGHDQILAINYNERASDARVLLSSFAEVTSGSPAPAPLFRESWPLYRTRWGESWLDGWDDEDDLAFAGDFLGRGYDQLLLINRRSDDLFVPDEPHTRIVDLHGPTPIIAFSQSYRDVGASEFAQREDRILVGDFRHLGHDQVLYVNTDPMHQGPALLIHDFALGAQPVAASLYSRSFVQIPDLADWIDAADRSFVGDFMRLGHEQLLLLNRQRGDGRVRILDLYFDTNVPITWYHETSAESTLLEGWHDALSDWIFPGDFAGAGYDQLLFVNRRGDGNLVMGVDFRWGKPAQVRYLQPRARATYLTNMLDDDDLILPGRFTPEASDSLLTFDSAYASRGIPERVVTSVADLEATLASRFRGRVVVPADVDWTLTNPLVLPTGTSLVGARGIAGSRPILRFPDRSRLMWGLIRIAGHHVRIEGLHLIGPTNGDRSSSQQASAAITSEVEAASGRGLAVALVDNEIEQWTFAAFQVANPAYTLTLDDERRPRQAPEDAPLIRVERNYLHHVARDGNGYGTHVDGGAYLLIEGNVFDRNRHAVSAAGFFHSGYIARHNLVLEGGFTEDGFLWTRYWNQHFDVHGTANDGYGGAAGEYFLIEENTIRGEQDNRPAFTLRGRPTQGAFFRNNVVVHDNLDDAVKLKCSSGESSSSYSEFNLHAEPGNSYDTDWIDELATGDFDGDGLADVFWATGTAWYYSSAGESEWRFLRASPLRKAELAFADLDGDLRTDVLWSADGFVSYARAGRDAAVPFAPARGPLAAMRFYDFTGDGKVDIFLADGLQWWLWDRNQPTWSAFAVRGGISSELHFGTFDAIAGYDVLWIRPGTWSFYSGARGAVTSRSTAISTSPTGVAAVDVDRDGRTDIVYRDAATWWWIRSAFEPARLLRATVDPSQDLPAAMQWGNFDGIGGLDALRWQGGGSTKFLTWRGLGSPTTAVEHARTMR